MTEIIVTEPGPHTAAAAAGCRQAGGLVKVQIMGSVPSLHKPTDLIQTCLSFYSLKGG